MVAHVAAHDPQIAPKPALAATVAAARLPGSRASHAWPARYRLPDSPAWKAKLPIMMKRGMTINA